MGDCQQVDKINLFLQIKITYGYVKLAELFISEIVQLHGVSVSIVSVRNPQFM
jgi:hypothetical protein